MRRHGVVNALFLLLMAFGIWSLPQLNKDEFPQFTIRQGLVVAVRLFHTPKTASSMSM